MDNNILELRTEQGDIYLNIFYYEKERMLYLDWHWKEEYGFDSMKRAFAVLLELLEKYQLDCAVENVVRISDNWKDMIKWFTEEWVPKAMNVGLKRWIFIRPDDYLSNLPLDELDREIMLKGLLTHNVKTLDEAKQLLDFPIN